MRIEIHKVDVFSDSEEVLPGYRALLTFTDEEMAALLAAYDESTNTSPAEVVCRPVLRAILDSVKA
jgi:hypothetical protein